ncbi:MULTISPECIES: trans-sulfuration enzyme family protein [unclassified Paenibacillus]|uniref:trans-sulfuration enzyme family protein n=1 Tax=unclassified Paenibacillus TaxID=185978 RepID=UPI002F3FB5B8
MDKHNICLHHGDDYDSFHGAIVPPIFQNTLFTNKTKDHGYIYTRSSNPTIEIAEQKIAALEEGEAAICLSSGMAAISAAILHALSKDDHVICVSSVYPRTRALLNEYMNRFGISVTYISKGTVDQFEAAIQSNTKLIYLESPSSLIFSMQDLTEIAKLAQQHGIITAIDNTWSTPLFQNPLKHGIDLVIHSATKYLGGHSDILGGIIVGKKSRIDLIRVREREMLGAIMDPHQAWLLIRSLRTLPVRMKQHQENALIMANFLEGHPKVTRVLYPGLKSHPDYELGKKQLSGYSGVMSFIVDRTYDQINTMLRGLQLYEIGPSWGGFESLISGIPIQELFSEATGLPLGTGLIRMSVGLEDIQTLMDDLDGGLRRI